MSNLHAKEYEIYEGKNLVAQTYGGPLYQHCNDKSYGEAVMLAKKMAACEDMYEALDMVNNAILECESEVELGDAATKLCHNVSQALKKARGEL